MDIVSKLKAASDSQLEVCYALLAIHIKNVDEISMSVQKMENSDLKERVKAIMINDQEIVGALMQEFEILENEINSTDS